MQSKVRAKILDDINYFLKLAIADYILLHNNAKKIIKHWDNLAYRAFESKRSFNHKSNRTLPGFLTILDMKDNRKVMVESVMFSKSDLGNLIRSLVWEYHNTVRKLLADEMLMDDLYEEFLKHTKDVFSCTD